MTRAALFCCVLLGGSGAGALPPAQEPPATQPAPPAPGDTVERLLERHDRALIQDLTRYIQEHPAAADLDQAYTAIFERAIERDWFAETETLAQGYLKAAPDGAVSPLARIIATMARARAGAYGEALTSYRALMRGLNSGDQEDFAASFSDQLALSAAAAGEVAVARAVYQELLDRFGASQRLRDKAQAELARLDLAGQPVPATEVRDLEGKPISLAQYRGKYLLIDVWATWCTPCINELPRLQALHAAHRDRGFEIVGIALDETPEPVRDLVKARQIAWRQVHQTSSGGDWVGALRVTNLPATYLVNPEGNIERIDLRGEALEQYLLEKLRTSAAADRAAVPR
jgi:thiol-disulfide isomerase/thioredoxin